MFGVTGEQHTRSPARKGVPTAQAPLMTAKSSIDCLLLSDVQLSPFGTYAATVRVEPCVREGRCAPAIVTPLEMVRSWLLPLYSGCAPRPSPSSPAEL